MLPPRRHHHQRSRHVCDRGQASLEWLAVVALVSSLLALGAGLAQADAVGRRVTREMARALCIVSDGDCHRDHEPCVLSSKRDSSHVAGGLLIFRLSEDSYGLIERLSDGTYAATIAADTSGGIGLKAGFEAKAHVGGLDVSLGGEATSSVLARISGARTWIAHSEAEAAGIIKLYSYLRPPDRTSSGLGWLGQAGGSLGIDGLVEIDLGSVAVSFDQRSGSITDHRTGRHTIYVTSDVDASARGLVLGSTEAHDASEVYAVEMSSTGRALALTITATGALTRSRDLPAIVQPIAGRLAAAGAERYEVTAALDLTEPAALAAASGLLNSIAHKRSRAQPSAALRRLIETQGTVEARVLAKEDDTKFALGANVTAVALEGETRHREERLLAAASRGLDGQWISREDCI